MTVEVIEGHAEEVEPREPIRSLVVAQPGQALVARPDGAAGDMIARATELATALKDVVERQNLYSVISGKKFPKVEAWMTIGRMDNVVAREAEAPIRHDDDSFEAFVELVRLSDGMVIGRASALCGTSDDKPWNTRALPARRAMAVTRATSRAFRQQYSWVMALAGYEPTPAEEMDKDGDGEPAAAAVQRGPAEAFLGNLTKAGTIKKGDADGYKLEVRQTPDGPTFGFRIEFTDVDPETNEKKAIPQCLVPPELAVPILANYGGDASVLAKKHVTIKGQLFNISQPGRRSYYRLHVREYSDDEITVPAKEAETATLFSPEEQANIDAAMAQAGAS